jgi:quercetin dioxygenase-like cupin family protein
MSEKLKQIAMRIKALREIAGVSVDELAKEFKVEKETYLNYESGTVDIPVSFLYEFAHKFNVELTALLSGEEPRLHRYSLVKKGKGLSTERRKEYKYQDLAFNFIRKKAEVFLVTVEPKKKNAVHHYSHPGQEFTYVVEGTLKVVLDGHEVVLDKGDALYFDSGHSHAMVALKGKPARFLAVIL